MTEDLEPRRGRSFARHLFAAARLGIFFLGLLSLLALLAGGAGYWAVHSWAERSIGTPNTKASIRVEIPRNLSARGIAELLEKAGLARPAKWTLVYMMLHRGDGPLRAGEYRIVPGTSPREILATLRKGPEAWATRVTIPEGWTCEQVGRRLASEGILDKPDRFIHLCRQGGEGLAAEFGATDLEGFLYPDTYFFLPSSSEEKVIGEMVSRFRKSLASLGLRPGKNSPHGYPLTLQEHMILASIIEREAADPEEMGLISSVFHNRLARKMPLGSCATVRHALNKWQGDLTMEDLHTSSPFNTYAQAGLPPGPICNPGKAAIAASFRPEKSPYLYYVYKGNRRHHFSESLAEHEQARRQYRDLWLKRRHGPRESVAPQN